MACKLLLQRIISPKKELCFRAIHLSPIYSFQNFRKSLRIANIYDERDNFTPHRAAEFGSQNRPSGAHISYKLLFKAKYIYHISDHSSDPVTMELLYARYLHTPAEWRDMTEFGGKCAFFRKKRVPNNPFLTKGKIVIFSPDNLLLLTLPLFWSHPT